MRSSGRGWVVPFLGVKCAGCRLARLRIETIVILARGVKLAPSELLRGVT
jgi:hypothetical protein